MTCKFEGVHTVMSTAAAGNTQDFTVSGFGTPVAAIFFVSKCLTDTTPAAEGAVSVGFTDGTTQRTFASDFQNVGLGNTNNKCRGETAEVIYIHNVVGTGTHGRASFSAWITDGVRVLIDTQFNGAYKVGVLLIGGTDAQAAVGNYSAPAANGTTTVSGLAFAPDLVFAIGNQTWNSTNVDHGFVVYGAAIKTPLTNAGYDWGCDDNLTTSACFVAIDSFMGMSGGTSNAEAPKQAITSFTSDGFVVTESSNTTGVPQAYLALHLPGVPLYLGIVSTPTATGNTSFTGFGFQPQAYMVLSTMADATAATQVDARSGACGIGFVAGATPTQHGQSLCQTDNVGTQVAKCVSDAAAAEQLGNGATVLIRAAHNAFLSDGVQMNFTITDATARKWVLLGIGSNVNLSPPPFHKPLRSFRRSF